MNLHDMIKSARGESKVDLLITNARMVNVFTGDIVSGNIAIANGYIVGFRAQPAKKIVDVVGKFVAPGFIDPHVHIESAMTCVTEFARAVLPNGTTSVVADPHEIANVLGVAGIDYMLRSSASQPMSIYLTLPSCVPATHMETSGARLEAEDLVAFLGNDRVVALAEMMNYPGVIHGDPPVLRKIEDARRFGKPIDGHAPGVSGQDLHAYIAAGISSDHECTTVEEAEEKLRAGMHIMIREGTGARNLKDLLPVVNARTARRMMWCTDDRHPHALLEEGHIDSIVREAIRLGLDPVTAIQMATLNPAEYFGLKAAGAIAPGRHADLVVFADLGAPYMEAVYHHGILVARDGEILPNIEKPAPLPITPSMNVRDDHIDFAIPAEGKRVRVIDIVPGQIITGQSIMDAPLAGRTVIPDIARDVVKIAVVERHSGSGNVGKALVRGFGLRRGAMASSVAHDSHNIIVVGANDEDMQAAVQCVVEMGGGLAAACNGRIHAGLALPVAGLMSHEPVQRVRDQLGRLIQVAREFGSTLEEPFMALSFLALPVIPELKITDKGLIDVVQFKPVPLFVD